MLRKPLKLPASSSSYNWYEDISSKKVAHSRYVDKTNDFGDTYRDIEVQIFDTSVPVTPQSGLGCRIGDLGFMLRSNVSLKREAAYLQLSRQSEPYSSSLVGRELANTASTTFDNLSKSKKTSKS